MQGFKNKVFTLMVITFFSIFGSSITEAKDQIGSSEEQNKQRHSLPKNVLDGYIDFNGYYDVRDFNVFTINALANLPYRFQYFSLTNYSNNVGTKTNFDLDSFYTEQNLRWGVSQKLPIDLTFQWGAASGANNDRARFGVRWRVSNTPGLISFFNKLKMFLSINWHTIETDFTSSINSTQFETVYRIQVLPSIFKDRVYVSGFADHNLRWGRGAQGGNHHLWVTEHQLGLRLVNWFYVVAEYRRNEFMTRKKDGLGLGLEYVLKL